MGEGLNREMEEGEGTNNHLDCGVSGFLILFYIFFIYYLSKQRGLL